MARGANCTTGLVLHTFRDKRALLAHAQELLYTRTAECADAAEAAAPPADRLRAVLRQAASLTDGKHGEARIRIGFLAAALADRELGQRHRSHNLAWLQRIERLLATRWPTADQAKLAQTAKTLVALVEGLNVLAAADPETYTPQTQADAIDAALRGLLTD